MLGQLTDCPNDAVTYRVTCTLLRVSSKGHYRSWKKFKGLDDDEVKENKFGTNNDASWMKQDEDEDVVRKRTRMRMKKRIHCSPLRNHVTPVQKLAGICT